MKKIDVVLLVTLALVVAAVITFAIGMALKPIMEQNYCKCMDSQPYITAKYYEGRCLMQVLSYEELDIVQYLFISESRCR